MLAKNIGVRIDEDLEKEIHNLMLQRGIKEYSMSEAVRIILKEGVQLGKLIISVDPAKEDLEIASLARVRTLVDKLTPEQKVDLYWALEEKLGIAEINRRKALYESGLKELERLRLEEERRRPVAKDNERDYRCYVES